MMMYGAVPLMANKAKELNGKSTFACGFLLISKSRRISVHLFLLSIVYSCLALNEGFVTMGKWPTYGPACLHRINPT